MTKLSTRYGDMFSCGWLPPAACMHCRFIGAFELAANTWALPVAHKFPVAPGALGESAEPTGTWVCAGNSEMFSVCEVSPPCSPRTMPLPTWTGLLPCRLGNPKVCIPSPPYVVPKIENSAWFWLMASNAPLQNAQPFGGKFQLMILISPKNGSDMCFSWQFSS